MKSLALTPDRLEIWSALYQMNTDYVRRWFKDVLVVLSNNHSVIDCLGEGSKCEGSDGDGVEQHFR